MIESEDAARNWLQKNAKKQWYIYERSKKGVGKRIIKKLFLRCQHKQHRTGKHTKSNRPLATTHKKHYTKHTNCPAQMTMTVLLPLPKHKGIC